MLIVWSFKTFQSRIDKLKNDMILKNIWDFFLSLAHISSLTLVFSKIKLSAMSSGAAKAEDNNHSEQLTELQQELEQCRKEIQIRKGASDVSQLKNLLHCRSSIFPTELAGVPKKISLVYFLFYSYSDSFTDSKSFDESD